MAKSAQAFRTIREVADWLGVAAHVLRFWESKFTQIKPVKRAGGRRYYRPEDMALVGGIKVLLHDKGQTIRAVQRMIRDDGAAHVSALSPLLPGDDADITAPDMAEEARDAAPAMADTAVPPEETSRPPEAETEAESQTKPDTKVIDLQPISKTPAAPVADIAAPVAHTATPVANTAPPVPDAEGPVADTDGPTHERFAQALAELSQMAPEFPKNRATRKALRPHIARLEKLQERLRAGGS